MGATRGVFLKYRHKIHDWIAPVVSESSEYKGMLHRLDLILTIGDRLVERSKSDPQLEKIRRFIQSLEQVLQQEEGSDSNIEIESSVLITNLEIWLNGVYHVLDPDSRKKKEHELSHHKLLEELGLIENNDNSGMIQDPVRERLLLAQKKRNEQKYVLKSRGHLYYPVAGLLSVLAPLYKHSEQLIKRLKPLICSEPPKDLIHELKKQKDMMNHHLEQFVGRKETLRQVINELEQPTGQYLVITGGKGQGKSAFCSKLSQCLVEREAVYGSHAEAVRSEVPWLPGCLLYFASEHTHPSEILQSLAHQANLLLLDPIPVQVDETLDLPEKGDWFAYERTRVDERVEEDDDVYGDEPVYPIKRSQKNSELLLMILEKAVEELGSVYVIIDGIHEIGGENEILEFLPETLPKGAKVVLTVPEGSEAYESILRSRNVLIMEWSLGNLTESEVALMMRKVALMMGRDHDSFEFRSFVKKVYAESAGHPAHVAYIAREYRRCGGDFSAVDVRRRPPHEFLKRHWARDEWPADQKVIMKKIQMLLVTFFHVSELELDQIQRYLHHQGHDLDKPTLYRWMRQVAEDIVGLREERIKLRVPGLDEHLLNKEYKEEEFEAFLKTVVEWLIRSDEDDWESSRKKEIISGFVVHWTEKAKVRSWQEAAEYALAYYVSMRDYEFVHDILSLIWKKKRRIPDVCYKYLQRLAEDGYDPFRLWLGISLIKEGKPTEGERWLRKAAERNNNAQTTLGTMLLYGEDLQRDIEEGERLLKRAVEEGNPRAMALLGKAYLYGEGVRQNTLEGKRLLEKAVEKNEPYAFLYWGRALCRGEIVAQDEERGVHLLRQGAESGNLLLMRELGSYLLKKNMLDEAEFWLEKAAEGGSLSSMHLLGYHLIIGKVLKKNVQKGLRLLRESAERGYLPSQVWLGRFLIRGEDVEQNVVEGENWLNRAVKSGSVSAMYVLSLFYFYGDKLPVNRHKGEELLRKAAEQHHPRAMYLLSKFLLKGNFVKKNVEEGLAWLRKAAEHGDSNAMFSLANRLLKGKGMPADVEEGMKWLRKAAERKDRYAMKMLGLRLINGDGVKKNPREGEAWLRKAIALNEPESMYELAMCLLNGKGLPKNEQEGLLLLKRSSDLGYENATLELAVRVLERKVSGSDLEDAQDFYEEMPNGTAAWNDEVKQDPDLQTEDRQEVLLLLRELAEKGDKDAILKLGRYLLDEADSEAEREEGKLWLEKGAECGDTRAMVALANLSFNEQDLERGEEWLRKAAEFGNSYAMSQLGVMLCEGKVLDLDYEEGERWLRSAAEKNNSFAMYQLGNQLLKRSRKEEGLFWLKRAARAGNSYAINQLVQHLLDGKGGEKNVEEGFYWLMEGVKQENPYFALQWALRLLDGKGVARNREIGENILRELAAQNFHPAMYFLGIRLLKGHGLPKNKEEGNNWIVKAAQQGNFRAITFLNKPGLTPDQFEKLLRSTNYRKMYLFGRILLKNEATRKQGRILVRKAAEAGDVEAMRGLGRRLAFGKEFPLKPDEGEKWLRKAMAKGSKWAKFTLAQFLLKQKDQLRNLEGIRLLEDMALQGDREAPLKLARYYLGENVHAKDPEKGKEWLLFGVNRGYENCMFELAKRLLSGSGIQKDPQAGVILMAKLAEQGNLNAAAYLSKKLFEGKEVPRDPQQAFSYMKRVIAKGDIGSIGVYINMLVQEYGWEQSGDEVTDLVNSVIQMNKPESMFGLGSIMLKYRKEDKAVALGEHLLKLCAEQGHKNAILKLVTYYQAKNASEEAMKWLEKGAKLGDANCMFILGKSLLEGDMVERDEENGRKWLEKGAQMGNQNCILVLAKWLLNYDYSAEGLKWLEYGAERGNFNCIRELASQFFKGDVIPRDPVKGLKWLEYGSSLGYAQLKREWAMRLIEGKDVDPDVEKGLNILKEVAEEGDVVSMEMLGNYYYKGKYVEQNLECSRYWYEKASMIRPSKVTCTLADMYFNDFRNDERGQYWLMKAANAQVVEAMIELGERYLDGRQLSADPVKGRDWLTRAAEKGSTEAMLLLGRRLIEGNGIPVDESEGKKWVEMSAQKGHLPAINWLIVNEKDPEKIKYWTLQECKHGSEQICLEKAKQFLDAESLKYDENIGKELLFFAANKGSREAMRLLGCIYLDGLHWADGMEPEERMHEGKKWLEEAANLGDKEAVVQLVQRYFQGKGLPMDENKAKIWLEKFQTL